MSLYSKDTESKVDILVLNDKNEGNIIFFINSILLKFIKPLSSLQKVLLLAGKPGIDKKKVITVLYLWVPTWYRPFL